MSQVLPPAYRISNRILTKAELETLFAPLLAEVRSRLTDVSAGDAELLWALRRKLSKELVCDERSKPMQRRALKARKRKSQDGLCATCSEPLPTVGAVLDRFRAMDGYSDANTRLLCPTCDTRIQGERGYA